MEPIPRHWAAVREVRSLPDGRELDLTVHGSSDDSPEDAQRDARERLERLVAAGGPRPVGHHDQEYYPDRRLPEELLQEVRSPEGELIGAITRNRYGAAVLNTDAVLVSDVDLVEETGRDRPPSARVGLLSRLFGSGSESAPDDERDPDSFGLQGPGPRGEHHGRTVAQIDDFIRRHPELGVRTYRTRNGFRLLITGSGAAPGSDRARELMGEVRSDELYMLLCRVHDTFRARLTPKPWRIHVEPFRDLGSRTAADDIHRQWVEHYRAASADVAVCRLLGATGPAPTALEQQIIDLHDRAVRPESGLRLA
ncbi:hypothetical protein [Brachybacterium fresconis]|uniref:Uncharacterized protein n=1 Tax=Brachybacterium fresconis TaxID=173363 RepID=A0ABS4YMC3_9MICO|nr:hypothetical protein [Brachybacterium fresconis]MBP2409951.1 hypothetical protein [Brachybacterium fresconis]